MGGSSAEWSAEGFADVLAAARWGASWAFEALYRWLAPAVVGYLRIQGAEDPEDLGSEVFLGVFHHLAEFRGDQRAFRSWTFTIAHRKVVDDRRKRSRRPVTDEARGWEREVAGSDDTEGEVLVALSWDAVRALCQRLSADQRDVVLLRLAGGLGLQETAAALGKSEGAVKALQHRAVQSLRRELKTENSRQGVSR